MRQRSVNYFIGSLFSRQVFFAYGVAGGITTAFQQLLLFAGYFSDVPTRTDWLPVFLELYIETLIPVWIGTITKWNLAMLLFNIYLTLGVLYWWTLKYDRSF